MLMPEDRAWLLERHVPMAVVPGRETICNACARTWPCPTFGALMALTLAEQERDAARRWSAAWKAVATRKRKALHHSGARLAMFRDRADMAEQLAYELGEDLRRYGAHLDTCAVAPCDCGLYAALAEEEPGC